MWAFPTISATSRLSNFCCNSFNTFYLLFFIAIVTSVAGLLSF
nr:MAG TPA: hypothetical protein [Caudoviricetes sp.]